MRYIEIGQEIIDAIKGGANFSGQSESEEIVGTITDFGNSFKEIVEIVMAFIKDFLAAIKK